MSPEAASRIQQLREKAKLGQLSLDEYREAIKVLREDRVTIAAAKKTAKAKLTTANVDDLLSELDNL